MFRNMRRFKQQLTDKECESILQKGKRGVLAVHGDGGYPYTVPLNFVYDDGCICFHSALSGHKIDALRRDDKASFCVLEQKELSDDGWSYFVNSVVVFGRLREITREDEKTDKLRKLGNKYFPNREMTDIEIEKDGRRCTMIKLKIEHMSGKRVHER